MALLLPLLLCFTALSHVFLVEAVWFTIPASRTKCVSEEIHANVVVLADYYVLNDETSSVHTVSVKVTSPHGSTLYQNENATNGQFAFTTTETGKYIACFWMGGNHQEEGTLSLDWKNGIFAKDWDSVAKKEKIEGVDLEFRKLEERAKDIEEALSTLAQKQWKMREVSEITNGRVAWASIMSLGVCILVSVLQILYLKRFFQNKKLI
ncbi:hypothetical protein RJT34_12198 [Clitoria ternatea]|uniref:GOLD domain-containing protein n=1 Tax=Clitoria ternatea TaxID=43366 RepID=A0AAN9JLB0_CLITE